MMAEVPVPQSANDAQPESTTQTTTAQSSQLLSQALDFLSSASNETLIACAVGVAAVLYIILGGFGLLLIGVIAGVTLHATWERQHGESSSSVNEKRRRQEVGIDVARRLLDWSETRQGNNLEDYDARTEAALKAVSRKELDFSDYPPETASALQQLTESIVRNYVKFWYDPILPGEDSFPSAARQTLVSFVLAFCSHQARKRPADALLNFLTNATSIFIVFLSELSKALMAPEVDDLDPADALQFYLDKTPESALSSMADGQEQERKLLAAADDLLQAFLDPKTYNCGPARLFLRQVFAGVVLQSILKSISQPEWINGWIIYLLEEGEPELISAIDAGVEGAADRVKASASLPTSSSQTNVAEALHHLKTAGNGAPSQSVEVTARSNRLSVAGDAMREAMDEAEKLSARMQAQDERTKVDGVADATLESITATEAEPTLPPEGSNEARSLNVPIVSESSRPSSVGTETELPKQFTSFDQITPAYRPVPEVKAIPPLTLHNARITIFDDAQPGDKSIIKSKPQTEYLLQIEPALALHSGWMVPRKHAEIEPLHEYLYKISNVSGAPSFARKYQYLPPFKGKTKDIYRRDLEKYLHDALSYEPLAESEGMKRFLDKDQGFQKSGVNKNPLAFAAPVGDAFQTVGKGMLGGFSTATKGVAAGGQAVFEGVGGLFGGPKKLAASPKLSQFPVAAQTEHATSEHQSSRGSKELPASPRSSTEVRSQPPDPQAASSHEDLRVPASLPEASLEEPPALPPRQLRRDDEQLLQERKEVAAGEDQETVGALPTPPASIRDSVISLPQNDLASSRSDDSERVAQSLAFSHAMDEPKGHANHAPGSLNEQIPDSEPAEASRAKNFLPIDEKETRVAIELMFAAINELYTLSSAWNIRRTLLNAAKNYLLRPGNPSLRSIKDLLQSSVLDANTSDKAIADHILKVRQNSMPTEAELADWPPPLNEEEKTKLRAKARKLLVTKGMPQALTSVMGTAASGEALGRVFEALQVERVSRALAFALLLQGLRAVAS